jgi:hypothetical protein
VRPDNTDEDLGSATGLPPFDGRLSSNNPNTDVHGDNAEGQTETQEVRNQEDEPEVRDHSLCQAWTLSGASWVPFGTARPPSPTIHYILPRFILKDPGLQPLRNPQKQGAIRDVMTNPKITLGFTRGG